MKIIDNNPVIILGMHRSGTSLLANLLHESGVFMGHDINSHFESTDYLKVNQYLLKMAHAFWDSPNNFNYLLNNKSRTTSLIEEVKNRVYSRDFQLSYNGWKRYFLNNKNEKWGWKEPRTSITFPIWKEVYPNAKYIIVYRNGIDVASSLKYREQKRQNLINKIYYSNRCLDINQAFNLWEEYNGFIRQNMSNIDESNIYELKYEELLANPSSQLQNILNGFLSLNVKKRAKKIETIRSDNAYKFLNDLDLKNLYLEKKKNKMMVELGYSEIL